MKVKLNIPERYWLIQAIPQRSNFKTMSILESLTKVLYPSEVEVEKYGIEVQEDKIVWNEDAIQPVELELTEKQIEILTDEFKIRSEKDDLNFNQYLLYKKLKNNG